MELTKRKIFLLILLSIILIGFLLPEKLTIPVANATTEDWNKQTFWYEPWGNSGVHKGIDIFAAKDTPTFSATNGIVLYTGFLKYGGNVVVILGPIWRIHYYAHLNEIRTSELSLVGVGEKIGTVGDSGNAKGKAPHLHYSIVSLFPYIWRVDSTSQGWKKMFYLDPNRKLKDINIQ